MRIFIVATGVALMLAACGGTAEPETAVETEDEESVFDPMTDQIDKAREAEDAALEHKEDIDKALEDVEG